MLISFNQAIDIVAISVKKHKTILTITLSFVPFIDYTVNSFFLLISFLITLIYLFIYLFIYRHHPSSRFSPSLWLC